MYLPEAASRVIVALKVSGRFYAPTIFAEVIRMLMIEVRIAGKHER